MDKQEAIAHLLAAEDEPEVKNLPDYQEAVTRVESDPAAMRLYESERELYRKYDGLLPRFLSLSEKDRTRMKAELRAERVPGRQ